MRIPAVGAAVAALLLALAPGPAAAEGAPLDVTRATADASAVEATVGTAYSFFVDPDAQLPRASAAIAASRSSAVASPADPGDNLDALGGVAVPMVSQTVIDQLRQGSAGAPPPLSTALNAAADGLSTVTTTASPVTGLTAVQAEHVSVAYPDPQSPGTHQASFGPDPSAADPTGNLAVEGATGRVQAGDGLAVAEAGGGLALASRMGVSTGRASSHAETHTSPGMVTSDAVSEVDGIDILPPALPGLPAIPVVPGSPPLLHIGALRTVLHAERRAGTVPATTSSRVEVAGAAVLGHAASLDDSGLHLLVADASVEPTVDALNGLLMTASAQANHLLPGSTPFGGHPVLPLGQLAGPRVTGGSLHGTDGARVEAHGLALTVAGTVLGPSSTAVPPSSSSTPVPQPVLLTLTFASARADAYGVTLGDVLAPPPLPPAPVAGGGAVPVNVSPPSSAAPSSSALTGSAPAAAAASPSATAQPAAPLRRLVTTLTAAPLPPGLGVAVASAAELLLLGALLRRYRKGRPRLPAGEMPGPEELV